MPNVTGRIQIAIMDSTTRARPLSILERKISIDRSTLPAQTAGGVKAADHRQVAAIPLGLVGQHEAERRPGGIQHALGQLASRQSANGQVFDTHCVSPPDQAGAGLVQKVTPLIGDLLMLAGDVLARSLASCTSLLSAAVRPLKTPQLSLGAAVEVRDGDALAVARDRKLFQADIYTDGAGRIGQGLRHVRHVNMRDQCYPPAAQRVPLEGGRLERPFRWPVLSDLHPADLGDGHVSTRQRDALGDTKGGNITFFGFEAGKTRMFGEEGPKCLIEIADGLLERLTIYLGQPNGGRFGLERGQLGA